MPIIIKKNKQQSGGTMGNLGSLFSGISRGYGQASGGGLSSLFGGGGGGAGGLSSLFGGGSSAGAGGASALGGLGAFAWPLAAVTGASLLSTDASKHGGGKDNWLDWMGPVYNLPKTALKGDWDGFFSDAATGPIGAIFNIAKGKNPFKSMMNSFGPAGQAPLALFDGKLPFSGKKGSRTYIDAFTGKGVW